MVRSTETREESERDQSPGEQEVGVGGNLPGDFGEVTAAGSMNEAQRTDEIINYEIGSTLTETVSEPGAIERVSVAVLVDGMYEEDANGELTFTPRDQAELDRLEELVRAAVGFDAERGDTVSVDSLQFVEIAQPIGEPVGSSFTADAELTGHPPRGVRVGHCCSGACTWVPTGSEIAGSTHGCSAFRGAASARNGQCTGRPAADRQPR